MLRRYYSNFPIPFIRLTIAGLIVAFLLVSQEYLGHLLGEFIYPFSWLKVIFRAFITVFIFLLLLPIVHFSLQFLHPNKWTFKRILLIVLISIVTGLFHQILITLSFNTIFQILKYGKIENILGQWGIRSVVIGTISSQIYFWVVFMAFLAARNRKILLQQEKELTKAELNTLKSQLQPHFLFNTLNSISSLMDFDVPASQRMLNRLSDLLRSVLDQEQNSFMTLEEELKFLANYLAIEEIRFSDRLEIKWEINQNCLEYLVPSLLLQPIVENALKHGIAKKEKNGVLWIKADFNQPESELLLQVEDNGPGVDLKENLPNGLGLSNVKRRLYTIYAAQASFSIDSAPNQGFKALLTLPAKLK